ncbi:hypothetical protein AX14_007767 [Amanita brunnescens Koide BX004]|nr:hypothetical protein AX14_007767 [Amanita brunnescens Koide BX004]
MVQTCTVTLTPTTNSNGAPAFQEVKSCNMKPVTPNGASSATLPPTAGSSTSPAQSPNSTPLSLPTSAPPIPSPPVVTTPSSTPPVPSPTTGGSSSTSPPSATTSSTTGGIIVDGGAPNVPTSVSGSSTTPPVPSSPFAAPGAISPTNSSSTGSSPSPVASAAEANQSATQNFKIPGKSLSVLPIGLGIFAGILVIALIVVGLVTYERTKYRKAFRRQRLAETGPNMSQV